MTHEPDTRTDQLITEMLSRRAARGASDGLGASILAATSTHPQHVGPLARIRDALAVARWTRVLVIAVVATGLIGGVLLAGGQRPDPTPPNEQAIAPATTTVDATANPTATSAATPTPAPSLGMASLSPLALPSGDPGIAGWLRTNDFARAFSYVVPSDVEGLRVAQESTYVYVLVRGHDPTTAVGDLDWGTEGLSFGYLESPVVHPCPIPSDGGSRVPLRTDPDGMAEDLRALGITVTDVGVVTIDGHEGHAFDIVPGPCDYADIHMVSGGLSGGRFIRLNRPGRIITVTVGPTPLVVLAYADTDAHLRDWLEPAQRLIDTIRFRD